MNKYNAEYIYNRILRLCVKPRSTEYILHNLDGLDLNLANQFLNDLRSKGEIKYEKNLWAISEKAESEKLSLYKEDSRLILKKHMGYFDFLKTPHPLDFEWRNTSASLNYLIELIQELNTVRDKILLLGMPTLFALAIEKDIPHNVTLIEKNRPIVNALHDRCKNDRFKIIENDIFESNYHKNNKHFFVFMDPPWYSKYFKHFLWFGAKCTELSGIVGISLPPLNTKDNISEERMEWLSFAFKQGLIIERIYEGKLNYTMPFFEYNAYSAAGLSEMSPFWRKGDLALFRKVSNSDSKRPKYSIQKDIWDEVEKEGVRFRVKINNADSPTTNLKFKILLNNDILPSISKSHNLRQKANVMTSGNRIFHVTSPKKFLEILKDLDIYKSYDEGSIEEYFRNIIYREKNEYEGYIEWVYSEMEKDNY